MKERVKTDRQMKEFLEMVLELVKGSADKEEALNKIQFLIDEYDK